MADLLQPNQDNADDGSLAGIMGAWLENYIRDNVNDMLPAQVVSYDRTKNRAIVQPLVMLGTTDGGKISRAALANLPVFRFGGGGFFISVPLKPGDFGWVKANDRDISLVMQRGGLQDWPNTKRLHSFSDAMFFPDALKGWAIDGKNSAALVLQSMDGSTCVSIDNGRVEIDAAQIKMNGDLYLNGDFHSTGAATNNGKDIGSGHTHSGVQSGSSNTGAPN